MNGIRDSHPGEVPDFFLRGAPMCLLTARAYFMAKNMQKWGADVTLHPWETWDELADRLEPRLEYHIWHPWHWQEAGIKRNGGVILRAMEEERNA